MMSKFTTLFLSLFCVIALFTSCEEGYDIDVSDFESKLVVNALFTEGDPWSVKVTSSRNILDGKSSFDENIIDDAKVEVYNQAGEFIYELFYNEYGKYSNGENAPAAYNDYHIKVSARGFKTVTATGSVPEKSTLTVGKVQSLEDEKENVEIDFLIEDYSNSENYYIWEVVHLDENGGNASSDGKCTLLSKTWLNNLRNNPENLLDSGRDILDNDHFGDGQYNTTYNSKDFGRYSGNSAINNGTNTSVTVNIEDLISKEETNPNLPGTIGGVDVVTNNMGGGDGDADGDTETETVFKYELRVMTISKELFDYYSSVEEYMRYTSNTSIQNPYEIYTNVDNGLGIFAGYSEASIQF